MATGRNFVVKKGLVVTEGIELGHVSDTTIERASAGDVNIESNIIYRAGGTDVPVTDGGTGVSALTDGGVLLGSGTSAITAMAVLTDGQMIVGDGTTDPVAESGATLRTSIGVGTGDSPQFTAIELGDASDTTIARSAAGVITVEGTAVLLAGAQTGITSILATDLIVGEDAQTAIDFGTADEIDFKAANAVQLTLSDGVFRPQTDSDVDLGTSTLYFKDAFIDKITTTGTIELGHATETTLSGSGGTLSVEGTAVVLAGGANHDGFSDFVANEHINHTSVSISAGSGLTGGGTIAANRTLTVGAGTGITVNTNDVAITAAQTGITSIKNTSLVIGRDADNDIDFATDNKIIFRAGGADQIKLQDGKLVPVTDNDIDLGTASLEFKNAYFDGTVTTDGLTALTAGIGIAQFTTTDGVWVGGEPITSDVLRMSYTDFFAASADFTNTLTDDGTAPIMSFNYGDNASLNVDYQSCEVRVTAIAGSKIFSVKMLAHWDGSAVQYTTWGILNSFGAGFEMIARDMTVSGSQYIIISLLNGTGGDITDDFQVKCNANLHRMTSATA
jgi:hypothetical protein